MFFDYNKWALDRQVAALKAAGKVISGKDQRALQWAEDDKYMYFALEGNRAFRLPKTSCMVRPTTEESKGLVKCFEVGTDRKRLTFTGRLMEHRQKRGVILAEYQADDGQLKYFNKKYLEEFSKDLRDLYLTTTDKRFSPAMVSFYGQDDNDDFDGIICPVALLDE